PSTRFDSSPEDPFPGPLRNVLVGTPEAAISAIEQAAPGDAITFMPGTYRFKGSYIGVNRAGTRIAPITVRADSLGSVMLEFNMVEGFLVSAPHWVFENL